MHKLIILIEPPVDPAEFDAGWPRFLHWAEQMPGLRREVSSRVASVIYGASAFSLVHELIFEDPRAALQALKSPAGQSAGETLQAITQGRVTLMLADHLEDSLENITQARSKDAGPRPEQEDADHG